VKKSLVDKDRYLEGMCEDTRVGGADYKVGSAMVLRIYDSNKDECITNRDRLALLSGTSMSTTHEATKRLRKVGYIDYADDAHGGRSKSNAYTINWDFGPAKPSETRRVCESVKGPSFDAKGSEIRRGIYRTRLFPSKKKITPKQELAKVLDAEHVAAVLEHRKAIKVPTTLRAAQLLVKALSACADPNAAADEMIMRGWRGLKAEWLKNRKGGRSDDSPEVETILGQRIPVIS